MAGSIGTVLTIASGGCLDNESSPGREPNTEPSDLEDAEINEPQSDPYQEDNREPNTESSDLEDTETNKPQSDPYQEDNRVREFSLGEELDSYTDEGIELRNFRWGVIPEDNREGVIGTVENKRDSEIADIRVSVDFYDGDTQIGSGWQMPTFLGSGEYARIGIPPIHVDEPERITRVALSSTVRAESLTPLNSGEVSVTDTFQRNTDPPAVSGAVTNETDERLTRVYIEIGFYDGKELVYWRRDGISRLGSGDSGEWEVRAGRHVENVTDYKRHVKVQQ